jgi:hypothetical protein
MHGIKEACSNMVANEGFTMKPQALCVCAAVVIAGCVQNNAPPPQLLVVQNLVDAIAVVETGGEFSPDRSVGDGGLSRGRFQIGKAFWLDSGVKATYQEAWSNPLIGQQVMLAYWARYSGVKRGLNTPITMATAEWMARTHNGGPKGYRKQATVKYWRKVKTTLGTRYGHHRTMP